MRLNEIKSSSKIRQLFSKIEKECSESLQAIRTTGQFLYRGTFRHHVLFYKSESKVDRESADTPREIQVRTDELLFRLGFEALRSNSIFVTSDKEIATGYGPAVHDKGEVFLIFPINGFKFTWSPKVKDFFDYVEGHGAGKNVLSSGAFQTIYNDQSESTSAEEREAIMYFKEAFRYQNTNLVAAIRSGNEIMVRGKYYALNTRLGDIVKPFMLGKM